MKRIVSTLLLFTLFAQQAFAEKLPWHHRALQKAFRSLFYGYL